MHRKSAYILFLAVLGLLVIGIVMLFSTSAFARDSHGDIYFFIRRQAIWFGIGLVVCTFAALVDYHFWQRTWWLWFALALVALALCYFPHIVMFVAGANPLLLGIMSLAALGALLIVATQISERMGRLSAFLHPQNFKEDAGLQQMQALIAWGSGGMEGLGLGNGRQKMLYLPYAHTDFIFPMIGEELGLRISLLVVFLFIVIIVCGMMIALHSKDRFGMLLSCGIVSLLALQAAVNIGVTTSLLPNKGLPLPFISYGGSNLVACMFGVGLLVNIYRQGVLEPVHRRGASMQVRMTPRI